MEEKKEETKKPEEVKVRGMFEEEDDDDMETEVIKTKRMRLIWGNKT